MFRDKPGTYINGIRNKYPYLICYEINDKTLGVMI